MLRTLRKKGVAKKILWVLAVMITISFVFWGISSSLTRKETSTMYAGKIFGRNVGFREFEDALQHVRNQLILRYGENFNKIESQLNIEAEAWDRLILIQEGKKRKIEVSNQDVIAAIKKFPFFQRNKKFDPQLYDQIIQYVFRCTPRDFEEGIRESLVFEKIYKQEIRAIKVSDEDVLKEYKTQNEKIQVDYVVFPFRNYEKGVVVTEEGLRQYYEKNKETFQIPFTVNINYLALEYAPGLSDEEKKKIADSAENMAKDVANNKSDLKQISKKYNLPMKESGFFSAEEPNLGLGWPLEVFQKALSLKKGDPLSIFSTSKGFYFLELKDTKESHLLTFDEAKNKVKEVMIRAEAKKMAEEKAKQALQEIQQKFLSKIDEKFETIVKKLGFKLEKTQDFTRAQYLPGIGPSPQFHQAAFSLTKEKPLSDLVEITSGYSILYLNNFIPADKEEFAKDKDLLKEGLAAKRYDQAFSSFLIQLRQKAALVDNMKKAQTKPSSNPAN